MNKIKHNEKIQQEQEMFLSLTSINEWNKKEHFIKILIVVLHND